MQIIIKTVKDKENQRQRKNYKAAVGKKNPLHGNPNANTINGAGKMNSHM